MTIYSVISLPKIPYMHRIYIVLANPTHSTFKVSEVDGGHEQCFAHDLHAV